MRRPTIGVTCIALATLGFGATAAGAQSSSADAGDKAASIAPPWAASLFNVTKTRRTPDRLWPLGLDMPHMGRPIGAPAIRFRDGRVRLYDRGIARSKHAEYGQSSVVTVDALRIHHAIDDSKDTTLSRVRSSIWTATLGYELRLDDGGTLRLAAGMGGEKRKPAIAVADGHAIGSPTRAIGLGWRDASGLNLDAGWFGVGSRHGLTSIERNVALAAGSPIAEHGLQASASMPLAHMAGGMRARLGLHLASAEINSSDLSALGASGSRDARATLSLALHY